MKLTHKSIVSLFGGLLVLGLGAAAQAQESRRRRLRIPPSRRPPATAAAAAAAPASASASRRQSCAGGPFGAVGQFVYDQSIWHLEGLFGFNSQRGRRRR